MSRRGALAGAALLILLTALTVLVARDPGAASSALSPAPAGLLVARRYLEERGTRVDLLDETYRAGPAPYEVLVVAFPWQRSVAGEQLAPLHAQVRAGATLVYAFSGDAYDPFEDDLREAFGLHVASPRGPVPLGFRAYRKYVAETWTLVPEVKGAAPITLGALARVPRAPEEATVLFRGPDALPVVFSYAVGRGRVIVLPVESLQNAGLPRGGNLDLLETLRAQAPGRWTFDEYHHGLSPPASPVQAGSRRVLDLYLLQLALLYGLGLLAVARRFGPAWSDPPQTIGSAGAFLVGLGGVHDRLGHHPAAARLLVERTRELFPHLSLPAPDTKNDTAASLVTLARTMARHQKQARRTR